MTHIQAAAAAIFDTLGPQLAQLPAVLAYAEAVAHLARTPPPPLRLWESGVIADSRPHLDAQASVTETRDAARAALRAAAAPADIADSTADIVLGLLAAHLAYDERYRRDAAMRPLGG